MGKYDIFFWDTMYATQLHCSTNKKTTKAKPLSLNYYYTDEDEVHGNPKSIQKICDVCRKYEFRDLSIPFEIFTEQNECQFTSSQKSSYTAEIVIFIMTVRHLRRRKVATA